MSANTPSAQQPPDLPEPAPRGAAVAADVSDAGLRLQRALDQQRRLMSQLRPAQLAMQNALEGILVTDNDGVVTDVNPAFERMTGFLRSEIVGQNAGQLYRWVETPEIQEEIVQHLMRRGFWRGAATFASKTGERHDSLTSISIMRDEAGAPQGRVVVFADITELRQTQRLLEKTATTDRLTGLPNALKFDQLLEQALQTAAHQGHRLAVFFVDVDHFKSINDTLGHHVGDEVLREAARTMGDWLGEQAVLCRRSGDEFLAFHPVTQSASEYRALVRTFTPESQIDLAGPPATRITLQFSAGVALFPDDAQDQESLFRAADGALYAAKARGRRCVEPFTQSIGAQTARRMLVERRLALALKEGSLRLAYQPQVDIHTQDILAFEALCRWHDEELGEVSPAEFVAVALDGTLAPPLGRFVLAQVLRDLPAIRAHWPHIRVALNASIQEMSHPDYFRHMTASILQAGPDTAQHLEIEVTEDALGQITPALQSQLQALRDLGCQVSMDDFGTGHSSLSRLHQLPLDKIKIDQSFVRQAQDARVQSILKAVIDMCSALGHEVIFEGVETETTLERLVALGARVVQGYIVGRPEPLLHWVNEPPKNRA